MHLRNEAVIHGLGTLEDAIILVFLLQCLNYHFCISESKNLSLSLIVNSENT